MDSSKIINHQKISGIINQYIESGAIKANMPRSAVQYFIDSFPEDISSIDEINDEFAFNHIKSGIENYNHSYVTIRFYRWLVDGVEEFNERYDRKILFSTFLKSTDLVRCLKEDYCFRELDPKNIPYEKTKVIFLLNEIDHLPSNLPRNSFIPFNISRVRSSLYRRLIYDYNFFGVANIATSPRQNGVILEGLMSDLEKQKNDPDYPDHDLNKITVQDVLIARERIGNSNLKLTTKNSRIGYLKRILEFGEREKFLTLDPRVYDYLRQFSEPAKKEGEPVPKEDLAKLNAYFKKKSDESLLDLEIYTIFLLCLETEFRIGNICALEVNAERPSVKPGQYELYTRTKTSHGEKDHYLITEATHKLINNIIEKTYPIRGSHLSLFMYANADQYDVHYIDRGFFGNRLTKACKDLGLAKKYSPKNLRDTHMTQSILFSIQKGLTDVQTASLTKHRSVGTTMNHYLGDHIEQILEQTYHVKIGDPSELGVYPEVRDDLPPSIKNKAHVVEGGCGYCMNETCYKLTDNIKNSVSCLICPKKHFVTTPDNLRFFQQRIDEISAAMLCTNINHDKEDLDIIKRIYVAYLKAIYQFIEENNGNE